MINSFLKLHCSFIPQWIKYSLILTFFCYYHDLSYKKVFGCLERNV